jgi:hypothetical protein
MSLSNLTNIELAWFALFVPAALVLASYLLKPRTIGSTLIPGVTCVLFSAFTAIQIGQEGVVQFYVNHTQDLTGLQVWWDLIMCVIMVLFLAAPRLRAVNMNVPLWMLFACCTASIGLLAMLSRLFWLENQAETRSTAAPAS